MAIKIRDNLKLDKVYSRLKSKTLQNDMLNDLGFFIRDKIQKQTAKAIAADGSPMSLSSKSYKRRKQSKGAPPIANMRGVGNNMRMLAALTHKVGRAILTIFFSVASKGRQALGLEKNGFNFMGLHDYTLKGMEKIEKKYLDKVIK